MIEPTTDVAEPFTDEDGDGDGSTLAVHVTIFDGPRRVGANAELFNPDSTVDEAADVMLRTNLSAALNHSPQLLGAFQNRLTRYVQEGL